MHVSSNKNLNLYQTGLLYNPQLQSAEMAEKLFVVRLKQFELLLSKVLQEKEDSIPQHHLIIGQRGMGKTTLLKRMEVELHKEQYRQRFIPLLYREDQYNVKDLSEFWLNTLDALADSLQSEDYQTEMIADIDKTIRELSRKPPRIISEEAYKYLAGTCDKLHRRPVLLIDNIGLVFSRLDNGKKNKTEQWALRRLLSENSAPVVIGGGVTIDDDVNNYNMPFYDFFQIHYLHKLNYEEFAKLLFNRANITNSSNNVFVFIRENSSRQKSLLELTGGSPRLTVMLFEHITKGFSSNINDDLEILADSITPLYKARFEELSTQQQIILDAIALNWDAVSLNKLSKATRMQNNQLSPQLKRLVDDGWLETTPAYKAKGNAYSISERFFNIYYLIRNSSRRHKDRIYCLSKFLECFYGKEELDSISDTLLKQDIHSFKEMQLQMAFWDIKPFNKNKRQQGKKNISRAFLESEELRKDFGIEEKAFFAAEENKLYIEGNDLLAEEKYEDAIRCFDKALEINPKSISILIRKGDILLELIQFENAIVYYDKAIELKPEDDNLIYRKSICLYFQGFYKEAIDCLNKAIELNPKQENYWACKGYSLGLLNNFAESLPCFERCIELDPKAAGSWNGKGTALFYLERYEEAIATLDKAILKNISNKHTWFWKAECLSKLERYEESIECYEKAAKLDDNYLPIWHNKGFALVEIKRYEDAAFSFEKARAINDKGLLPKFNLIFLYRDKLSEMDKAVKLLNSIKEEDLNFVENNDYVSYYYLNKTLFELYKRNEGLAREYLLQAFGVLEENGKLSSLANMHFWAKFASVIIDLGYSSWLLSFYEEKGYDIVLSPYYTAIKTLEIEKQDSKNGKEVAEIFLNNIAIEISDPARIIISKIRKHMLS